MKTISILTLLLAIQLVANSQETALLTQETSILSVPDSYMYLDKNSKNPISKFALSFNVLGFVQFGPVINADIGITDNIALNAHVRFTSLGLLSYVVRSHYDGLDELSGVGFGGEFLYFFGERMHKPYVGILIDHEKTNSLYAEGANWEWTQTTKAIAFAVNGGYRFRFSGGFFMNTGLFLGVARPKSEWEFTDPTYTNSDNESGGDNKKILPFGMFEVTLGFEF